MNYRKKPLKAHCIQFTGDNLPAVHEYCAQYDIEVRVLAEDHLGLHVPVPDTDFEYSAVVGVPSGYWVARQENGEVRVYDPDLFEIIYEELTCN
jgi:hypothetical protein